MSELSEKKAKLRKLQAEMREVNKDYKEAEKKSDGYALFSLSDRREILGTEIAQLQQECMELEGIEARKMPSEGITWMRTGKKSSSIMDNVQKVTGINPKKFK